jgi:diguanylate cyclase (GGDEF)-like protein
MTRPATLPVNDEAFLTSRIDSICSTILPMVAMNLLGTVMMASFFWQAANIASLTIWCAITLAVQSGRVVASFAYRSSRFADVTIATWCAVFTGLAIMSGVVWGSMLCWMIATGTDNQIMLVVCITLGAVSLAMGNVTYWPIYASFELPVTFAGAIGFVISGRPGHLSLAISALALMVSLLTVSYRISGEVLRAHRLALANQALADSLSEHGRELERAFSALERVSRTDPLTGLANRRSRDARLMAEWDRAIRAAASLSVIAIDVDHFKRYNDSHGHDEGDRCLQAVSEMLQAGTRGAMDMAARHGGEEFMLILPGIAEDAAASIAERVRVAVATCSEQHDLPEKVTISLGVATIQPAAGRSIRELTMAADAALYRAKIAGRNRYEVAIIPDIGVAAA